MAKLFRVHIGEVIEEFRSKVFEADTAEEAEDLARKDMAWTGDFGWTTNDSTHVDGGIRTVEEVKG